MSVGIRAVGLNISPAVLLELGATSSDIAIPDPVISTGARGRNLQHLTLLSSPHSRR
jgi:hypothetical protein